MDSSACFWAPRRAPVASFAGVTASRLVLLLGALSAGCSAGTLYGPQGSAEGGVQSATAGASASNAGGDASGEASSGNRLTDPAVPAGSLPATPSSSNANAQSGNATSTASTSTTVGQVSGATALKLSTFTQQVYAAYTFNNEQQNYTDNNANVAFRADGSAVITAKPTGGTTWTSARLMGSPIGKLPLYIEATVQCPTGLGVWPAFWLTANGSWPQGGEIDIMEQVNGAAQNHISNHWGQQTGVATFNTHEIIAVNNVAANHRYGAYLTDGGVQFYQDGVKVGAMVTYPAEANFSVIAPQMVPLVNLAIGGTFPSVTAQQSIGEQTFVVTKVIVSATPPK